ncbi:MAG TPA: hypothetical protein VEY09_00705 [Pyrinomonadaceae bacterium]|nr:hypothetical protein [Pyrinomonadaceae bacterium]
MRKNLLKTLVLAIAAAVSIAGLALARGWTNEPGGTAARQEEKRFSGRIARKQAKLKAGVSVVTIELNGVREADVINLRPGPEGQLDVRVGGLLRDAAGSVIGAESIPDSTIKLTAETVSFTRPDTHAVLVLDAVVPTPVQTCVVVDGEVVLASSISEPLSIIGRRISRGHQNLGEAFMLGGLPSNVRRPDKPVKVSDGVMFVPFEKLQILKSTMVSGEASRLRAMLSIDESGRVMSVKPLAEQPPSGFEEEIRQWEFAPYLIEGRATKVITIYARDN